MEELTDLVTEIKQATDFQVNKKILKEKIQTDLHMIYNGGMFKLTPALFAFVATWPADKLYLEDCYENPIQIDKNEFLNLAQQQYQKVMNYWHQSYDELRQKRKI